MEALATPSVLPDAPVEAPMEAMEAPEAPVQATDGGLGARATYESPLLASWQAP